MRRLAALVMVSVVALSMTGCATQTARTTAAAPLVDLVGTTWSGTDSTGDATAFTFAAGAALTTTFGSHSYHDPHDTWSVTNGILTIDVYLDQKAGVAVYTGRFDPATQEIIAKAVTSVSRSRWTVDLALSS